mgnify:CR=1 FL=1
MDITYRIITDLTETKQYWHALSPNESIYDLWDFRFAFYKYHNFPLASVVSFYNEEPVAFLGIEYNPTIEKYESFGTYFMETNRVFTKPGFEWLVPEVYRRIPCPMSVEGISLQDGMPAMPVQDYTYNLPLQAYDGSFDTYWHTCFSTKTRNTLKRKFRDIEEGKTIQIEPGTPADIDTLFALNIKNFEKKFEAGGEKTSTFLYPHRMDTYRDLLTIPDVVPYFQKFIIDGETKAVSLILLYRHWYIFLNTGANAYEIPNLGTYVYYKSIEHAFSLYPMVTTYDAGMGAYHWKERFHLNAIPQYIYERPC